MTEKITPHLWFDKETRARGTEAFLKMKKFDIAKLKEAYRPA